MTVTSIVTLDEAYDWLNITGDTSDFDYKMQQTIDAATAYVQRWTGPILPLTVTDNRDGGGPYIFLDFPPVQSVTSLVENIGQVPFTLTAGTIGVNGGAYQYQLIDPVAGKLARLYNGMVGPFAGGDENIAVTYVAGVAAVDADVKLATLEDIRGLWTQTQYGSPATVGGAGSGEQEQWSGSALNPIQAFPRLAALLQGTSRPPALA